MPDAPESSPESRPEKRPLWRRVSDRVPERYRPANWRVPERFHPANWKAPRFSKPDLRWSKWSSAQKITTISVASVLALVIGGWVALNLALADPRFGTPAINWTLHTFGNKTANVETARLQKPFTTTFVMQRLDWPARAEAEEIAIDVDLLGWLPGRPWAKSARIRNGEITLGAKKDEAKTFQPEQFVDTVDAENVVVRFTRRGKPREVTILTASGSFSRGTVTAEAEAGRSHLTFDGLSRKGGGFGGAVHAKGQNLKELADVLGASAPDTPPFDVRGELSTHARRWEVESITGRMGDSDIGGLVVVDLREEKPFLTVDLASRELDFDDMGVVFGIPIGTGRGETTNAEQRKSKAAFDRSARLIPDTRIDFGRLAAVNGDISFRAAKVIDAPAGITAMTLEATLRDSVLDFERALIRTGRGDVDAKIRINATKDPATTRASGTLENVPINRVVPTDYIRGSFNGKFALNLTGSGFRQAFGSATGEVGLWSNNSELAKIATEAAGLDIGEILLLMAQDKEREYIKSNCLAANLAVADGMVTAAPVVLDNNDSLILATGGFNLKTEALDLKVFAAPKDVSIGKLFGDIYVRGTLRNPDVQAPGSKGIIQVGISALLSSIAGPLAALPFIELGGGPDAPCQQLVADAREAGVSQDPTLKKRGPNQKS